MKTTLSVIAILIAASLHTIAQPRVGEQAYEIILPDVNGVTQKLSDQRGKVVLVDFWASWCGPCRKGHPALAELYSKYKNKGFEIFGVSLDDEKKAWKKAIAADRITWKQVNETGGWDAAVAVQWKLEQIPASFLIDQQGKVIAVDPTREEIENRLKTILR